MVCLPLKKQKQFLTMLGSNANNVSRCLKSGNTDVLRVCDYQNISFSSNDWIALNNLLELR